MLPTILTSSMLPERSGRAFETLYACRDEVLEFAVEPTELRSAAECTAGSCVELTDTGVRLYLRALVGVKSELLNKI